MSVTLGQNQIPAILGLKAVPASKHAPHLSSLAACLAIGRGRVALKGKNPPDLTNLRGLGFGSSEDPYGDDTPRMGGIPASYAMDMERERDREFLEGLRLVLASVQCDLSVAYCLFNTKQQSRC